MAEQTESSRNQSLQDEGTDIPENVHTDESPDIRNASVEDNDDEGRIVWQNNRTDDDRNVSQRTMRFFGVQVGQDFVDGAIGGDGQQFHLPRNEDNIAATGSEDFDARFEEFGIIYREEAETPNRENDEAADNSAASMQQTDSSRRQSLQDEGTNIPENVHTDESPDIRNASVEDNDDEGRNDWQNNRTDDDRNVSQRTMSFFGVQVCQYFVDGAIGGDGQHFDLPRNADNIAATGSEDVNARAEEAEINNRENAYCHYEEVIDLGDQSRFSFPSELHEVPDEEPNLPQ